MGSRRAPAGWQVPLWGWLLALAATCGALAQDAAAPPAACGGVEAPTPACRDALATAGGGDLRAWSEAWVQARRYAHAQVALEQLARRAPNDTRVELRLSEVRSLAEESNWLARRAAATGSAAAEVDLALAETRCTRLAGEVALAACDRVLEVRPDDARIAVTRGDLLLALGRPAEALAAYRAAALRESDAALARKIAIAEAAARPPASALDQQLAALERALERNLISRQEYERQRSALLPRAAAPAGDAAPAAPEAVAFGSYHALVIGIDAYRHLERLDTAVKDARAVGALLRRGYGFEVRELVNATRADIVEVLDEYRNRLDPNDNLLIYYAGHGWLDNEADKGFWLPADAHPDKRTQWVSNDTVRDALRAVKAKHVLVVADSCFSGTLTRGGTMRAGRSRDYVERMARLKARQVLTSGGLEPVADSSGSGHSPFATALLAVLEGNRGVLDATSLFTELRRPVALSSEQVPQFADIRLAGHQGGDFLFVRRR